MISPSKMHPRFWPSVWSDPELAADAEALALKIVGQGTFADVLALAGDPMAPGHILALARDIAKAQIDRRRIDEVQCELSRGLLGDRTFADLVVVAKRVRRESPARSMILAVEACDRRACARLKKANRAYSKAQRQQQRSVFRLVSRLQRNMERRTQKAAA
jgi:hypothetical protein